jgi:hypothetical protein
VTIISKIIVYLNPRQQCQLQKLAKHFYKFMIPRLMQEVTFKDIQKVVWKYKEGHPIRQRKGYVSFEGEVNKYG